jgi:hypothetical protein
VTVTGPGLARIVLSAVALTVVLGFVPATLAPVAAARPELTLVADARYVVAPDDATVHVTVDLTATNHKKDTTTRAYYFDRAYLAVLPGTDGFVLTGDGISPSVRVAEASDDYTLLLLSFGTQLRSGRSLDLQLTFDLPDPGGSAVRDVRVGQALATFPIWGFGSDETPGGSVEVVFPADYTVSFASGTMAGPETVADGSQVYRSGRLDAPLRFFAYVVADRPGAYVETALDLMVGSESAPVVIRAWQDDPAFADRVGALLARGLPALGSAIGAAYPRSDPVIVQEAVSRTLGGYAGVFDPAEGRVMVDYSAEDIVVLHEAAHIWFNGSLLAERWANEAFASYYGSAAATALGIEVAPPALTEELEAARIPLNAWGPVGDADQAGEAFAYVAAAELARLIAERAGDPALRGVWRAASERRSAYQPGGAARPDARALARVGETPATFASGGFETMPERPDWRGLLDLLEAATGRRFDDLWRAWVVRAGEVDVLDQRATTRTLYETTRRAAGAWRLPAAIRSAMTAWRFDEAGGLLAQAGDVLEQRAEIEDRAALAGLTPPSALELAFEGSDGLRSAAIEAAAELAAIDTFAAALGSEPVQPSPIELVGLMGEEPEEDLASARAAFAAGDLSTAVERSEAARAAWLSADEVGLRRIAAMVGAALLLGLALAAIVVAWRRRRRRRSLVGRRTQHRRMAHPDPTRGS